MIGTTLAHFRVVSKLGEGGMGEVWRAEDTKLGREVALKVLPDAFAQDADRMARFAREAQVLASLNHPNIAGIHQLEESAGVRFLVMELVEGETLAERIGRGQLELGEVLQIALQITAALEEAHDRGIVHRDLKPANVKITPRGQVKVLDFGLAKALEDAPRSGSTASLAHSPTITAHMTTAGVLLGTAAYMSPEQARGDPADRRADIWAFGVVLMEMLTGRTVYPGKTLSDTLASVLAREPAWSDLPGTTPPRIRRLLDRCLRKEIKERLQAIGEARIVIEEYLADPSADERVQAAPEVVASPTWKRALPWAIAVVAALSALWALWPTNPPERAPTRSSLVLPENKSLHRGYGSAIALSPDGLRVVYAFAGDSFELYLRSLDQRDGALLFSGAGSDRPYQPFFSPDGAWVGFATPNELKKVPARGGSPITLCRVNLSRGASWGPDGTIVLAPTPASGLHRVSDAGGEPQPLTELDKDKGELTHRWPQVLPGGKAVLFTSHSKSGTFDEASIEVLDLATGQRRTVHRGGTYARYVRSGHLVYVNRGTLFALPFDLDRREATGTPFPVVEGVNSSSEGGAQFDVSDDGRLVYSVGLSGDAGQLSAVWVDRQGATTPILDERRDYRNPRVSPDGTRLAVDLAGENADIWIVDLERQVPTRLTFDDKYDGNPVWSPDGRSLAFASARNGPLNIYRTAADGSGGVEQLTTSERSQTPTSWSADGTLIAYMQESPDGGPDLWLLPLEGGEPVPFLATPFIEYGAEFSPDGRWLAYGSNESGDFETYVRPVRGGGGKWQVSSGGGAWPAWSRDGRELFYTKGRSVHAVEVEIRGDAFRVARPRELFSGNFPRLTDADRLYDVGPDGQRFVMFQSASEASPVVHEHLDLVTDWFADLRAPGR